MPPHCDTMDGPVVKAADAALKAGDVNLVLPWVPEEAEPEVKDVFERVIMVRNHCDGFPAGVEVAGRWFFETVVRLHRAGEGASFAGLKPSGLDTGPVIPRAEAAIETGDAGEVVKLLCHAVEEEVSRRFKDAMAKQKHDVTDVAAAREYVEAMLDFMLYSHGLYKFIRTDKRHGAGTADKTAAAGHKH